jgi:hypothetical protein
MPPNSRAFGHRSSSFLETEAQSGRGIDVVALEKAVGQSAIHLREHCPDINVPLCRKVPIDRDRDSFGLFAPEFPRAFEIAIDLLIL